MNNTENIQFIHPDTKRMLLELGFIGEPMFQEVSVKERLPKKGHYITNVGHDVAFNPETGNWFVGRTVRNVDWWLEEGITWQQVEQWLWDKHKIYFRNCFYEENNTFDCWVEVNKDSTHVYPQDVDSPITAKIEGIKYAVKRLHKMTNQITNENQHFK